jgi:hypothetical protein
VFVIMMGERERGKESLRLTGYQRKERSLASILTNGVKAEALTLGFSDVVKHDQRVVHMQGGGWLLQVYEWCGRRRRRRRRTTETKVNE